MIEVVVEIEVEVLDQVLVRMMVENSVEIVLKLWWINQLMFFFIGQDSFNPSLRSLTPLLRILVNH